MHRTEKFWRRKERILKADVLQIGDVPMSQLIESDDMITSIEALPTDSKAGKAASDF